MADRWFSGGWYVLSVDTVMLAPALGSHTLYHDKSGPSTKHRTQYGLCCRLYDVDMFC